MFWKTATEPIETERDLTLIERMLNEQTPVNVKLRQIPRLIASLRRAWRVNAEQRQENAELRRRLGGRRSRRMVA
jgi:hypothetical protein